MEKNIDKCPFCKIPCNNSHCPYFAKTKITSNLLILLLFVSCEIINRFDYMVYLPDGRWICQEKSFNDNKFLYNCQNETTGEIANSINANHNPIVELRR